MHPTWQGLVVLAAAVLIGVAVGGAFYTAQEVREDVTEHDVALQQLQTRVGVLESDMTSIMESIEEIKKDSKENLCLSEAEVNPEKHWTECKK